MQAEVDGWMSTVDLECAGASDCLYVMITVLI